MGYVNWINEQSKLMKILLFFPFWGGIVLFLYKLFIFINDTSKTMTLVGAILDLFWIGAVVDWVLTIIGSKPLFVE